MPLRPWRTSIAWRDSRLLICAADFSAPTDLVGYLTGNCRAGSSSGCDVRVRPAAGREENPKDIESLLR